MLKDYSIFSKFLLAYLLRLCFLVQKHITFPSNLSLVVSVYITSNKNIELGPNVKILLAFDIEDQRLGDMAYLYMVKSQIYEYKSIKNH